MSTSSLTVVPNALQAKLSDPSSVHVLIRMYCTFKFASQIPLAPHYFSFLLSAQHVTGTQICVEPHRVSESTSEGLIRSLSFRLSNQKARLTEECLEAKPGEFLTQGSAGCGKTNLEPELSKKQKANQPTPQKTHSP